MPGVPAAFLEEETSDAPPRLLATFAAVVRLGPGKRGDQAAGLSLDDALAWGCERSGLVLVRFGHRTGWWSAGPTPHWSYPPWPPPDAPELVPRPQPPPHWREPGFEYDAGLQWAVTLWLTPEDLSTNPTWERREDWRAAVAAAASECRARWDGDSLDAFLADASGAESFFTTHPAALRIHLVVEARDEMAARETAAASCSTPRGFRTRCAARPADLDDEP
jgi:hypothetical protein